MELVSYLNTPLRDAEFDGWDWMELLQYLSPHLEEDEKVLLRRFENRLDDAYDPVTDKYDNKQVREVWLPAMRKWLGVFANHPDTGYDAPLWKGLAQIEHDWTFAKYFVLLIKHMWN